MTTRLRVGTRTLAVTLAPDAAGVTATVEDAPLRIAGLRHGPLVAAPGGGGAWEVTAEIDGRPCRAVVARLRDRVLVAVDGQVHAFEVGDTARTSGAPGGGSGVVTAPMPGKVIAVLVAPGDTVEAGQPLVLLEAMKMETTLAAEIAGTIETVAAVPGTLVEGGQTLVRIVPAAT